MHGTISVHGTAVGDDAGGFPAQGAGVDQFACNADGNFLRRDRFDGHADGGMHPVDGFFRDAPFPQLLIHGSGFLPGADNTHIGKVASQRLIPAVIR